MELYVKSDKISEVVINGRTFVQRLHIFVS